MWTQSSDFELLKNYSVQRHMTYFWTPEQHVVTPFFDRVDLQLEHPEGEAQPAYFNLDLNVSAQKDAKDFITFFNEISAKFFYFGPKPEAKIFAPGEVSIILRAEAAHHIEQTLLFVAIFEGSLKNVVLNEMRPALLLVREQAPAVYESPMALRQRLDAEAQARAQVKNTNSATQKSQHYAYDYAPDLNEQDLAEYIRRTKERYNFEREDIRDLDKLTQNLSSVVEKNETSKKRSHEFSPVTSNSSKVFKASY